MDYCKEINGRTVEFIDDGHIYLVDGVQVTSITQMLGWTFGRKYDQVDPKVLKRAAEQGTAVHDAIEAWCREGKDSDLPEVRNFKFLQKTYGFEVVENEVPVVLSKEDIPVAVGRLDMVIRRNGVLGLADIKRTAVLDKAYLMLQLNLYRLAYQQTYGKRIEFLRGLHLREDIRKFVQLPINETATWTYINDYLEAHK